MKNSFRIYALGLVGAWLLRLINFSLRWHWVGLDGERRYWADGPPTIITFWHGRQLFIPWIYHYCCREKIPPKCYTLISKHGDGRIVAEIIRRLKIDSVAGSSTRGGSEALRKLIQLVKEGAHAGITPDGPRGPLRKCKPGVVDLARKTSAGILPLAFSAERGWRLKSWDQMFFPRPFSRAVAVAGELIMVPENLTDDRVKDYAKEVEEKLNEVTDYADAYFSS